MRQTSREFATPHHECLSSRAGNLDWLLSILLGGDPKRFVLKALGRRFLKTQANDDSRISSQELFERLKSNSRQWHQASNTQLAQAVSRVNSEMDRPRVTFVKIDFPAAYSF